MAIPMNPWGSAGEYTFTPGTEEEGGGAVNQTVNLGGRDWLRVGPSDFYNARSQPGETRYDPQWGNLVSNSAVERISPGSMFGSSTKYFLAALAGLGGFLAPAAMAGAGAGTSGLSSGWAAGAGELGAAGAAPVVGGASTILPADIGLSTGMGVEPGATLGEIMPGAPPTDFSGSVAANAAANPFTSGMVPGALEAAGSSLMSNPFAGFSASAGAVPGAAPASSNFFSGWLQNPLSSLSNLFAPKQGGEMDWLRTALGLGSSVYGMYQANNMRDIAAQAAAQQDPFAPYRAQYAGQLSGLMADPSSITKMPGYEAGLTAARRSGAASGYLDSGNEVLNLANYGSSFFDKEASRLSSLAGAGFAPSGGNALIQGNTAANNLMSQSLASLGYTFANPNDQLMQMIMMQQLLNRGGSPPSGQYA